MSEHARIAHSLTQHSLTWPRCLSDVPEDLEESRLYFAVWDWDRFSRNDYMGSFSFPFAELVGPGKA